MSDGPVFVVGCPRSGTTLLNAMLSRHPHLAITHEWRFVPQLLSPDRHGRARDPAFVLEQMLAMPKVDGDLVDPDAARRRLAAVDDPSVADAIRCVFEVYAHAVGRPRWGDKTPRNVRHIELLAEAFPDACFVHIIRDGREVADANNDAPWGGSGLLLWANEWAGCIASGRAAARHLGNRYFEVRYECLVTEPEATLRRVCSFLGEPFVAEQLDYPASVAAFGDALPAHHRNLLLPPTPGLRDWRSRWTRRECVAVEALIGPLLEECGYPRSVPIPPPWRRRRAQAVATVARVHHAGAQMWRDNRPTARGIARRLLPLRSRA